MPVPVTPGQYIQARRLDAGLTTYEVAVRIGSFPNRPAADRAEMVRDVELGLIPVRLSTVLALSAIPELDIDMAVLAELIDQFEQDRFGGTIVSLLPTPEAEPAR